MTYELIALDMDGTLLDSNKQILPSSLEAMAEAAAQGKSIAICSGRAPIMISEYRDQLPHVRYAICGSGAALMDLREDRILHEFALEQPYVEEAIAATADEDVFYELFSGRTFYYQEGIPNRLEPYNMQQYGPMYVRLGNPMPDIRQTILDPSMPVLKLNIHGTSLAVRDRIRARLAHLPIEIADSETYGLELSPTGVNKGAGLMALADQLGIDRAATIAVGDADNDLTMLRDAGLGVAMGNANQNARNASDVSVADCDSDGVAEAIRTYLLA